MTSLFGPKCPYVPKCIDKKINLKCRFYSSESFYANKLIHLCSNPEMPEKLKREREDRLARVNINIYNGYSPDICPLRILALEKAAKLSENFESWGAELLTKLQKPATTEDTKK